MRQLTPDFLGRGHFLALPNCPVTMINPSHATTSRDEESSAHMLQLLIALLVKAKPLQKVILNVSLRTGLGVNGKTSSLQTTSMPPNIRDEGEHFMRGRGPTFSFVFDILFKADVYFFF